MKPRDTVGGYRGSGDGATMRPPAPLPSASMGKPSDRDRAAIILSPTDALEQAANLSRRAFITVADACDRGEPEGAYYDQGLLDQAAQLAQVASALLAYVNTVARWAAR